MADSPSESSLQILGGALNGQRYVFPPAADEVTIGADPGCSFVLEAPGVSPLHARLIHEAGGWVVHDCRAPQGLYLNDNTVGESAPLTDGDFLWLGEPGSDQALMVQVRLSMEPAVGFEEAPVEAEPEMAFEEAPAEAEPAYEAAAEAAPEFEEAPAEAPLAMESESAGFSRAKSSRMKGLSSCEPSLTYTIS